MFEPRGILMQNKSFASYVCIHGDVVVTKLDSFVPDWIGFRTDTSLCPPDVDDGPMTLVPGGNGNSGRKSRYRALSTMHLERATVRVMGRHIIVKKHCYECLAPPWKKFVVDGTRVRRTYSGNQYRLPNRQAANSRSFGSKGGIWAWGERMAQESALHDLSVLSVENPEFHRYGFPCRSKSQQAIPKDCLDRCWSAGNRRCLCEQAAVAIQVGACPCQPGRRQKKKQKYLEPEDIAQQGHK